MTTFQALGHAQDPGLGLDPDPDPDPGLGLEGPALVHVQDLEGHVQNPDLGQGLKGHALDPDLGHGLKGHAQNLKADQDPNQNPKDHIQDPSHGIGQEVEHVPGLAQEVVVGVRARDISIPVMKGQVIPLIDREINTKLRGTDRAVTERQTVIKRMILTMMISGRVTWNSPVIQRTITMKVNMLQMKNMKKITTKTFILGVMNVEATLASEEVFVDVGLVSGEAEIAVVDILATMGVLTRVRIGNEVTWAQEILFKIYM